MRHLNSPTHPLRSADLVPRPLWMRSVAVATLAVFLLQGCGSGFDQGDSAPSGVSDTPKSSAEVLAGADAVGYATLIEKDQPAEARLERVTGGLPKGVVLIEDSGGGSVVTKAAVLEDEDGVYKCTITQPIGIRHKNAAIHQRVQALMAAKGNYISDFEMKEAYFTNGKLSEYVSNHLRSGADILMYPDFFGVTNEISYQGWKAHQVPTLNDGPWWSFTSKFTSHIVFFTAQQGMCRDPQGGRMFGDGKKKLLPFEAAIIAAAVTSAVFLVGHTMFQVAFPEISDFDAYAVSLCLGSAVGTIAYQ